MKVTGNFPSVCRKAQELNSVIMLFSYCQSVS